MDPRLARLHSGRIVVDTFRDANGRPIYIDAIDTRTGDRSVVRGAGWDVSDRSRSYGQAISEAELPDVIEYFMEVHQSFWKWTNSNKALITLPNAFIHSKPAVGDILKSTTGGETYTVAHVPTLTDGSTWNLQLLLDREIDRAAELMWMGNEARERNLVNFHAEDGKPGTTTPGEDTDGDVGTAYPHVVQPTITHLLETQRPGSIGAKPFGQSLQLKPRYRETLRDPLSPQESLEVRGWWMDNLFRFLCLHPRAVVATRLARWFKHFMITNIPSLKASGLTEVLYWSQEEASNRRRQGDDSAARAVRYYFRTEEIEVLRRSNIRKVNFHMSVAFENMDTENLGEWDLVDPWTGTHDETGSYLWGDLYIADTRGTGTLP